MATYQEASDNLASGGLTGNELSMAQSSLANAYGVGTPTGANFGASAPAPQVSQTQDASQINTQLSGNTQGTVFPTPAPAPTKSVSNNTSVPNPIASPQDIISQGNAQTPGEQTNQSLLQKVASLIGQKQSQQGMINTSETNAGVPALTKTVTDLNTQLEGLNNQAADLQNQARPGGAIENTEQQNVLGRGVTAAGLAPQTAGDLRKNQIQQSAIASQALTLKSAIYGAQGQLSLAKDAADKAATAQYEDQQNQIDYQKALIDANLPQMNKEEKNQALLVQTQLQDRQQQIDAAKQDKQTIIAMVAAAFKNNPNDPAAHYAAQQALALSNQQQPDIQKAFSLIGKYQSDPLDTQMKIAQIAKTRADTANTALGTGATAALSPYLKSSYDGKQYVDLSSLTPTEKQKYAQLAQANGVTPILDSGTAGKLNAISDSKTNLASIASAISDFKQKGLINGKDIPAAQGFSNSIASFFGNSDIKSFNAWRTSIINNVQALAGGQGSGLRINKAEIDAAMKNDLPILTGANADTYESAVKKLQILNQQLDTWNQQILGGGNVASGGTIRVKIGNQTGTIDASQFDPKTMTKL